MRPKFVASLDLTGHQVSNMGVIVQMRRDHECGRDYANKPMSTVKVNWRLHKFEQT